MQYYKILALEGIKRKQKAHFTTRKRAFENMKCRQQNPDQNERLGAPILNIQSR